jgi:hypothetical protein
MQRWCLEILVSSEMMKLSFFYTRRTVGVSLRKGETKETRGDNSNLRDDQTERTQIHSRFGSNVGIYLFSAY